MTLIQYATNLLSVILSRRRDTRSAGEWKDPENLSRTMLCRGVLTRFLWRWLVFFDFGNSLLRVRLRGFAARALFLLLFCLASLQLAECSAARSVKVIIKNDTDRNMTFISGKAAHGKVTKSPPRRIPPSGFGELFAESDGVATGTEGTVTYRLDAVNGTAAFHWDNPFVGSNSANGSAPHGYQVSQIGDKGNRTLVFFSIHATNHAVASCNPDWILAHLGTHAEEGLDGFDEVIGFLTTPLKRMGIGGWVDTGCSATAVGWPVRDAQHSTDGFWTIDIELQQLSISGRSVPPGKQRYVRIEVEPKTPAHNSASAKANRLIEFHGRVLIDTHHGDELIEVHPWDPIKLRGPNPPGGSYTQVCRDQWVDGASLRAVCRKRDGAWINTTLANFARCRGDISDQDGRLSCPFAPQPPNGSYKQSCRNISTDGTNLRAACRKRNGQFVNTALNNYGRCASDISNQDGSLRCKMR